MIIISRKASGGWWTPTGPVGIHLLFRTHPPLHMSLEWLYAGNAFWDFLPPVSNFQWSSECPFLWCCEWRKHWSTMASSRVLPPSSSLRPQLPPDWPVFLSYKGKINSQTGCWQMARYVHIDAYGIRCRGPPFLCLRTALIGIHRGPACLPVRLCNGDRFESTSPGNVRPSP